MSPHERERLVRVLGMLGSAHDGEVVAAARQAAKIMTRHGLRWEQAFPLTLATEAPEPDPVAYINLANWRRVMGMWKEWLPVILTEWEVSFADNITRKFYPDLTPKQRDHAERVLRKIADWALREAKRQGV